MIELITAICALKASTSGFSRDAALNRARHIFKELGVGIHLPLRTAVRSTPDSGRADWRFDFTFEYGHAMVTLDSQSGRTLYIMAFRHPDVPRAGDQPPTPDSVRRVWSIMRTLGYGNDKNVKLCADSGFESGPGHALVYLQTHGLRFFNMNPTYAHRVLIDPKSGAIEYFEASPSLPAVNEWRPDIQASAAVERIRVWTTEQAKKHSVYVDTSNLHAELGYWKFASDPKARLVWRACKYTQVKGASYSSGAYRIFVDALTGKLLEPDDPSWGANP